MTQNNTTANCVVSLSFQICGAEATDTLCQTDRTASGKQQTACVPAAGRKAAWIQSKSSHVILAESEYVFNGSQDVQICFPTQTE